MRPLTSPAELHAALGASDLRVIEVKLGADGGAEAFAAGHVPGAGFSTMRRMAGAAASAMHRARCRRRRIWRR